uniref:Centrosomin N-terminal motif 1 domain-containing protein n=1 Tax=Esox lucius TaxID=8010 RepID=A0AAY5KYA4_ESOLU
MDMSNSYRTLSQHLNDLKKENFSLKLRIYFLEERIQQKYEDSSDHVYRTNIELKVEVESLKQELQEKQDLLDKALSTAESLSSHNEAELQRRCEERQQEIDHMQELLQTKIQLLQEVPPCFSNHDYLTGRVLCPPQAQELYQLIEGQNATLCKLREMAHQGGSEAVVLAQLQGELVGLKSSLFSLGLELEASQRAQNQSQRQAEDLSRAKERLHADLKEALLHREVTDKHNQDLRRALAQSRSELQAKEAQLKEGEAEKHMKIQENEMKMTQLKHSLKDKERQLQEYSELLESADRSKPRDALLDKLRERIRDRDRALERSIDEKFRCLEEREEQVRRLQLALREKERDLERLRCILYSNEETITSLDALVRAKELDVEQAAEAHRNLQWLQQQSEEKEKSTLRERDTLIDQLQTALKTRSQETQDLTAALLAKVQAGPTEVVEELKARLTLKEKLFQELLSDRSHQSQEHQAQVQDLLGTIRTKDQYIQVSHSAGLGCRVYVSCTHQEESSSLGIPTNGVTGDVGGFWQHVEAGLREQAGRLRSDLALSRQESRELQERLMVSEATVHAQAEQLKEYRELLTETSVEQDSKQVQVDLQDLGYETCGRSENEVEREDASSPGNSPLFSLVSFSADSVGGAYEDTEEPRAGSLQQLVQDLRSQLTRCHKVIRGLQIRVRSLSTTSDYASSLERTPRKVNWAFEASPAPSGVEEDEGWMSDSLGPRMEPKPSRELRELVSRVASLEAQLKSSGLDGKGGVGEEGKSATWPGKYNTLIQAQARELSHLRQRMREGRGVCHILTQHLGDTTKAFEELLRANDIDYYMGQSFREQLAQSTALAQRVGTKINGRDRAEVPDDKTGHELLALRLSKELQQKDKIIESLHTKLQQRPDTPSSSHALSETTDQSDRTSFVSDECRTNDDLDLCSDVDAASEYAQEEQGPGVGHNPGNTGTEAHSILLYGSTRQDPVQPPTSSPPPTRPPALWPGYPSCLLPRPARRPTPRPSSESRRWHGGEWCIVEYGEHGSASASWFIRIQLRAQLYWYEEPVPLVSFNLNSSVGAVLLGVDVIEEHLREVRCLRQRLEESIRTNERLRQQLEERLANTDREGGAPTNIYIQGLDSVSKLSNEIRVLKEENLSLQARLQASSGTASLEAEQLREAVGTGRARLKQAELEAEQWKEELRRLQTHSQEQGQQIHTLRQERQNIHDINNRLQHEVSLLQQQLCDSRELLQSLQSELQVYDRVCANAKGSPGQITHPIRLEVHGALELNLDPHSELEGDAPDGSFSNRNGRHTVGHVDDYNALQQQVLEGRSLVQRMETALQACLSQSVLEGHQGQVLLDYSCVRSLLSNTKTLKQILEEAVSLLKMFWRAALPNTDHSTNNLQKVINTGFVTEILSLRGRISEQEEVLQGTIQRLRSTSRTKESMENFIVNQLSRTRDVLKKARTNLEVRDYYFPLCCLAQNIHLVNHMKCCAVFNIWLFCACVR